MMVTKEAEKRLAVTMRTRGRSLNEIASKLKVSKGSASLWTRGVLVSEEGRVRFKTRVGLLLKRSQKKACSATSKKFSDLRCVARLAGFNNQKQNSPLHVMGCMLYWAEGDKTGSKVSVTNTDPIMIAKFVEFLRSSMGVSPSDISVSCRVHPSPSSMSLSKCSAYWARVCGVDISKSKAYSATEKKLVSTRKARYPYGVARVRVNDFKLLQEIFGALERYTGQRMSLGRW